jgi:hypothetical protein
VVAVAEVLALKDTHYRHRAMEPPAKAIMGDKMAPQVARVEVAAVVLAGLEEPPQIVHYITVA